LTYASKAFLCLALARLMAGESVGLDVASAGEIFIARRGGADPAQMQMHSNNKTPLDLSQALQVGVGRIVVDNAAELDLLAKMAAERQQPAKIWLRINPDVAVETHHRYTIPIGVDLYILLELIEWACRSTVSRQVEEVGISEPT